MTKRLESENLGDPESATLELPKNLASESVETAGPNECLPVRVKVG